METLLFIALAASLAGFVTRGIYMLTKESSNS